MAANTSPIFTDTPNITVGQTVATANTAKDGTGTVVTIHTAGADNSYVYAVNFQPMGTNTASVGRVFINNGSTNATAGNNSYYKDISLPATTNSEVAGIGSYVLPMGITLPAGYKLHITIGTTVAAGFAVQAIAEDF
jgi:hypothetical protein